MMGKGLNILDPGTEMRLGRGVLGGGERKSGNPKWTGSLYPWGIRGPDMAQKRQIWEMLGDGGNGHWKLKEGVRVS